MLNEEHKKILKDNNIKIEDIDLDLLSKTDLSHLNTEELVKLASICNILYRAGYAIVPDQYYDQVIIKELVSKDPNNPYLNQVESEGTNKFVKLPKMMLSTNKAYTKDDIGNWIITIIKACSALNIDDKSVILKATPKLDGFAVYDDGITLYTRGDGYQGSDIGYILDRGVEVVGGRGLGPGELVVSKDYFNTHLANEYENSRNFQTAVIREKQLSLSVQLACESKAIKFHPFSLLPSWQGVIPEFIRDFDTIIDQVWNLVDYDVDGVVIEVLDANIKQYLGHTRHHHRWQIAFKRNEEAVEGNVIEVIPQTGMTGRITPVVAIEPIQVSGVTVSRATAHNYGHVVKWSLGPGSVVNIVRSGLVIPKIVGVVKQGNISIPDKCPSCGSKTAWENDHLVCSNLLTCPAQLQSKLLYFFTTINNCDGFGPKTIETLCNNGIKSLRDIYNLDYNKLTSMGFGPGESSNLILALENSRKVPIEDWRFLAAFNIPFVGKGGCELLLKHYSLSDIFYLTKEQIMSIKGLGDKSSDAIINALKDIKDDFDYLYSLKFKLNITPHSSTVTYNSPIANKSIVFTGTMLVNTRETMEKEAKELGAKVSSSVTSKTDYLVVGEKPGNSKLKDAEKHNTTILTEDQYRDLLAGVLFE